MREFFKGWRRIIHLFLTGRPMSDRILEIVANQSGVNIDVLRSHPACQNLDNMTSLELVEVVTKLTDENQRT